MQRYICPVQGICDCRPGGVAGKAARRRQRCHDPRRLHASTPGPDEQSDNFGSIGLDASDHSGKNASISCFNAGFALAFARGKNLFVRFKLAYFNLIFTVPIGRWQCRIFAQACRADQLVWILRGIMESFIVFLIYGIICGGFCCFLAETKNRDTVMWFLSGFFFGVIALFVIGVVAPLEKKVAFEEKGKF